MSENVSIFAVKNEKFFRRKEEEDKAKIQLSKFLIGADGKKIYYTLKLTKKRRTEPRKRSLTLLRPTAEQKVPKLWRDSSSIIGNKNR